MLIYIPTGDIEEFEFTLKVLFPIVIGLITYIIGFRGHKNDKKDDKKESNLKPDDKKCEGTLSEIEN